MRWLPLLAMVVLVAAASLLRDALGIEWSTASVRDVVQGFGWWAPVVFVLLLGFRQVVLIPSQILLVAAGLVFGARLGTLYGALGVVISGLLVYGLSRWVGGSTIRARIPEEMHWALDLASSRSGAALLALGTAYPVGPVTAYHMGAGLSAMAFGVFVVALVAGGTARAALFTYLGSSLADGGTEQLIFAGLALIGVITLPFLHPRTRAWVRRRWTKL